MNEDLVQKLGNSVETIPPEAVWETMVVGWVIVIAAVVGFLVAGGLAFASFKCQKKCVEKSKEPGISAGDEWFIAAWGTGIIAVVIGVVSAVWLFDGVYRICAPYLTVMEAL